MTDFKFMRGIENLKYFTKIDEKTWFVQRDKNSICESFHVTLIPGGLCMSGDYDGVIVMPYTRSNLETINWMRGATSLSYFTEKVRLGNQTHQIDEYDEAKAGAEIAYEFCTHFELDETMEDWFRQTFAEMKFDMEQLREELALSEHYHPDSYPQEKFDELVEAIKQVVDYGSLENEMEYYKTIQELEHCCGFCDLWELDPREYTRQIKWQQHCLIWWASNVIDRLTEESFEATK